MRISDWSSDVCSSDLQGYLLLAAVSAYVAWANPTTLPRGAAAAAVAIVAYPLAWYLLHRYVLHGQWMFKSPLTARTWKRIHYAHHQDPNHLEVLFGARSEEQTSELQSLMRISYAVFCLSKKNKDQSLFT